MSKHIFLIDPLEKLKIAKDSSLLMALSAKELGHEVFLLWEKDFYFNNKLPPTFALNSFSGKLVKDAYYIESFSVERTTAITLNPKDTLHMRLDPPFNTRYLRILWMLRTLEFKGITVTNSPLGILTHNEKITAYEYPMSPPTYVGSSLTAMKDFVNNHPAPFYILKPLDLYQGIGVEKCAADEALFTRFSEKVALDGGAIVVQPFLSQVESGEARALYFRGKELGSILKKPKKGEFLANIAQGASYELCSLSPSQKKSCDEIASFLHRYGIHLIAFDLLGDFVQEVNITCPGLINEISNVKKENMAIPIFATL